MNEFFDTDDSEARDSIRDIARDCPDLIILIREFAAHNGSRWQHHIPAMQRAIEGLRKRCEYELRHLGEWREDYLQPDEIAEDIGRRFCRLTQWLSRMVRNYR
jgi:hypothetical protein